jgi:tripartite-type tricarboxylate transporter receptor subunit TctC
MKLSTEVGKILAMPDIAEKLVASGMEPHHTGPEKMAAQMQADRAESAKVIKIANIKLEME